MLWLERTDAARAPLEGDALTSALDAAFAAPHPWVTVGDEWGSLLRLDATSTSARVVAREVSSDGVRWYALGATEPPGTQTTLHLTGRTVKVAPTEIWTEPGAADVMRAFATKGAALAEVARRPLSGDHGRLYMMAIDGEEPRPVMAWAEIARQLRGAPADGPLVGALSEPGRVLIGVFGVGDRMTVTVQETRGPRVWTRRVEQAEGGGAPQQIPLPAGSVTVPARQVLTRADAITVVESLYRFDVPPPGFSWTWSPPKA